MKENSEKRGAANTVPSCPVPSFAFDREWEAVKERVEAESFPHRDKKLVDTIALAVVQMERKAPETVCNVNGEAVAAGDVQAIYRRLTHEHIVAVVEKYRRVEERIRRPLPYLQAMLYNVVFEMDLEEENEYRLVGG